MDYQTIIKFYGGVSQTARALGYTRAGVYHWRKNGVSERTQQIIQFKTKGRLKAKLS